MLLLGGCGFETAGPKKFLFPRARGFSLPRLQRLVALEPLARFACAMFSATGAAGSVALFHAAPTLIRHAKQVQAAASLCARSFPPSAGKAMNLRAPEKLVLFVPALLGRQTERFVDHCLRYTI